MDVVAQKREEPCRHLTVYFEDKLVTFKQCEGYDVDYSFSYGRLIYTIEKEDTTNQFNKYEVYHNIADELIDEE